MTAFRHPAISWSRESLTIGRQPVEAPCASAPEWLAGRTFEAALTDEKPGHTALELAFMTHFRIRAQRKYAATLPLTAPRATIAVDCGEEGGAGGVRREFPKAAPGGG